MGEQIESETGVSVTLKLTYDNLKKIIELITISNLRIYVSGYGEYDDEVYDFNYEEDSIDIDYDILDELSECNNQEEYDKKYNDLELTEELEFHFMYVCTGMYAENLTFRKINRLFESSKEPTTALDLIKSIQKAIDLFKSYDVPDNLICIGHTMRDG